MKKRLLALLLTTVLSISFIGIANAKHSDRSIYVNGTNISQSAVATEFRSGTTYVSLRAVATALEPDAVVTWKSWKAGVTTGKLTLTAQPGNCYIEANGRYLYVSDSVKLTDGRVLVPVRVLAQALGATIWYDASTDTVYLNSGTGAITSGDSFYDSSSVYWLSRIISAESQGEPMTGQIAVGNVILNRVASDDFPDTIYDVIFDQKWGVQFTPVSIGTIYWDPTENSVIAAKLCLEGVNVVGNALYFIKPSAASNLWVSQNRTYIATIGVHNFYA